MSDEHDNEIVRAAFDRLRHDARAVDTAAARRGLDGTNRPSSVRLGVLGAAIVIIVGIAVWSSDDQPPHSVTTVQSTTAPDSAVSADALSGGARRFLVGTHFRPRR